VSFFQHKKGRWAINIAAQITTIAKDIPTTNNFELLCGLFEAYELGLQQKDNCNLTLEDTMSWSVTVTSPTLPDVQEPIFSFSSCPGNICSSVIEMKGKHLSDMSRKEAIKALKDLIKELDKENDGIFTDSYAVDSDKQWSDGKETTTDWLKFEPYIDKMPFKTYEQYCGYSFRERVRITAVRFFLYYTAGYEVNFKW